MIRTLINAFAITKIFAKLIHGDLTYQISEDARMFMVNVVTDSCCSYIKPCVIFYIFDIIFDYDENCTIAISPV